MFSQAQLDVLLKLPAAKPPPGVTQNLTNPTIYGWNEWLLTVGTCLPVTTLFLAMRMYTKLVLLKQPVWEDCKSFLAVSRTLV